MSFYPKAIVHDLPPPRPTVCFPDPVILHKKQEQTKQHASVVCKE